MSYLRYSSKEQAKGGSEKRQTGGAAEYCEAHGLELIDEYRDLGISGYTGKHSTIGNLAKFLEDCKSGQVPQGIHLIVEHLDRLSREEVPIALQRFLSLINDYKITIHTTSDGYIYAPGKIELTELIISIVAMGQAHGESKRKSYLTGKAWKQKRELGKPHSRPGKLPMGRHPNWLDWDCSKQEWIPKEEAVAAIKYIFKLALESDPGLGRYQIARKLNNEGIPVYSPRATRWTAAMIKRITTNRSLAGEFHVHRSKDPNAKMVEEYYPVIIDAETLDKVEVMLKTRDPHGGRPGKKHQHAILTGISWYLGCRLHKGHSKQRGKDVTKVTYTCIVDTVNKYFGYADPIEQWVCSLIKELSDEELSPADNAAESIRIRTRLDSVKNEVSDQEGKRDNLIKAIGLGADIPELVAELEKTKYRLKELSVEADSLHSELNQMKTSSGIHDREQVKKLLDAALVEKKHDARVELQMT
ncbi:MAG: recombinase family protein, partial [Verrucomicrobiales bacterium]